MNTIAHGIHTSTISPKGRLINSSTYAFVAVVDFCFVLYDCLASGALWERKFFETHHLKIIKISFHVWRLNSLLCTAGDHIRVVFEIVSCALFNFDLQVYIFVSQN